MPEEETMVTTNGTPVPANLAAPEESGIPEDTEAREIAEPRVPMPEEEPEPAVEITKQ